MLNLTIALDGIVGSLRPPPYPTYAAPFGAAFFLPRDSAPLASGRATTPRPSDSRPR